MLSWACDRRDGLEGQWQDGRNGRTRRTLRQCRGEINYSCTQHRLPGFGFDGKFSLVGLQSCHLDWEKGNHSQSCTNPRQNPGSSTTPCAVIPRKPPDCRRTGLKWLLPAWIQCLSWFGSGHGSTSGGYSPPWPVPWSSHGGQGSFLHELNAGRHWESALRRRHLHCRLERGILP